MSAQDPIGVFDSGVGGLSVLRALRAELPREHFVYFADTGHAPYGEKGDPFVTERSRAILDELLEAHRIKALVVACNTATAAGIHLLREAHPKLPIVGVEPALKPASVLTLTGKVAVFATRGTINSQRVATLRDSLQHLAQFVLQPCDGLAAAIEAHDREAVRDLCEKYVREAGTFGSGEGEIDTLVLGCTHYPFARDVLQSLVGADVRLVETGEPVARQTRRMLDAAGLLRPAPGRGGCTLLTTGSDDHLAAAAQRWLDA
ncbi:glutamate racemase [Ramlibacter sp.]|uniref:glutamate racemase n=1 Tax=Ramlibacter sp. TaxID=1917967 RepID=UPI003D148511